MDIQDIQHRLAKPALKFTAGGFRPTYSDEESWLGRVFLFREDEELPRNSAGETLLPFAQFYLPALPFHNPLLEGVRVLTVFVANPFPEPLEPMGERWLIREYRAEDVLVRKELTATGAFLKPFPLKPEAVPADFPLWDGGGVPEDLEREIVALEQAGTIECYYDLVEHCYEHKLGLPVLLPVGDRSRRRLRVRAADFLRCQDQPQCGPQRQPDVLEASRERRVGAVLRLLLRHRG